MATDATRQVSIKYFTPSNVEKGADDIQLVMDVVLAILICLGESGILSSGITSAAVLALSSTKLTLGVIGFIAQERKRYVTTLMCSVAMVANIVLSGLVLGGSINLNVYSIAALGIDLGALLIKRISKRCSGGEKSRYSCVRSKPSPQE